MFSLYEVDQRHTYFAKNVRRLLIQYLEGSDNSHEFWNQGLQKRISNELKSKKQKGIFWRA